MLSIESGREFTTVFAGIREEQQVPMQLPYLLNRSGNQGAVKPGKSIKSFDSLVIPAHKG